MFFKNAVAITFIFLGSAALAQDEPLWEYGVGVGYLHYEHYPASDEYSDITLPFPTFQYRGKILRADDREGARAYLLRSNGWSLEFSGSGYPSVEAGKNKARQGMESIPWMIQLGPQIRKHWGDEWQMRLSLFQNIATDLSFTKFKGELFEGRILHKWSSRSDLTLNEYHWQVELSFSVIAASRALLGTYFDVSQDQATGERPAFESRSGLLAHELAYYQQIKKGHLALYFGATCKSYNISANRASPLHKSDYNLTSFVGLTYLIKESGRKEVQPATW